ncbi:aminotransferase class I/II-fold pyridoxal phosphate-dependent enzyme [bacterium]|nr:MAG: aminotransferase class I/II-fold pyridoxal phosphate-dependent enzyme [bacterium]
MNKTTYSDKLKNLGTETAFAVSIDATEFAQSGNSVFPFHLGDINISTPKNIIEETKKAMYDNKNGYVPANGIPQLRDTIAETIGFQRGVHYNRENVVVQPGGKPVIPKFINTFMNEGDGVLYPNPGYPIYESQIEYNGGKALPYRYIHSKDGFSIDREHFENMIDKNTKLLVYNNYQNPIGGESTNDEMNWIADIAQKYNLWVLSDEAYFNIQYSGNPKSIVSLPGMKERTVILYTFSKTYAMTGWRLGAAIGPEKIMKIFSKLGTNDESCTNHFIQYGGIEALAGNQDGANKILNRLRNRRDTLAKKLNQIKGLQFSIPNSTFYLFPDVTEIYNKMNAKSYEDFRRNTLLSTGVSFCTREHFGKTIEGEKKKYIRFAFSGISEDNINIGIEKLNDYWSTL